MKKRIFLSYPDHAAEVALNLRACFAEYGVQAWVFNRDRRLGGSVWARIESAIRGSNPIVFLFYDRPTLSPGQVRELDLARSFRAKTVLPAVKIDSGVSFGDLERGLDQLEGWEFDTYSPRRSIHDFVERRFPALLKPWRETPWRVPRPASWLEVRRLDDQLGLSGLRVGDLAYFRSVTPLGLLECFVPRIEGLHTFLPSNLRPSERTLGRESELEREQVPVRYRLSTMIDVYDAGLRALETEGRIPLPRPWRPPPRG